MTRMTRIVLSLMLLAGLVAVPGCKKQMVQVESGETVLCTEGHVVSDTVDMIEVPADEVADHGVTTRVIVCDLHEKLAALYRTAEQALAAGDLEAAELAFADIVSEDPSYRDAGDRLTSVRGGAAAGTGGAATGDGDNTPAGTGDSSPGGTSPTTPDDTMPGGSEPVGPIANLVNYVPDRIPGFIGQSVLADPFVLFRDYLPEQAGAIGQLAVEVEQFRDADHARQMLDERVRERFAASGEDVKIGTLEGYVGTRPNYVRLGMLDGAVMISLEFYTTSSDPAEHKATMIAAAKAIAGQ